MGTDDIATDDTPVAPTGTPHPLTPAAAPEPVSPSPTRRVVQLWPWVVVGAVAGVAGNLVGRWAKTDVGVVMTPIDSTQSWLVVGALLVGLLCSLWPHILLHEVGHALAGRLVGLRPVALAIGQRRWERKSQRWRRRASQATRGVGGYVLSLPTSPERHGAFADAVFLAGGALVNLGVGALAIWLASTAASASDAATGATPALWRCAVFGFGLGGLMIGVVNLLPIRVAGWNADGRMLLDLILRHPEAHTRRAMLQVMALSVAGVRPRNWPATMLPDTQTTQLSPITRAAALSLRLMHALDAGHDADARAAATALHALEPTLQVQFRPQIAIAMAMHAALCERDAALLAAWRARTDGLLAFDNTLTLAWLDTEQAHLDGDAVAAASACARVHAALDDEFDLGMVALVQARLTTLDPNCIARSHSRP